MKTFVPSCEKTNKDLVNFTTKVGANFNLVINYFSFYAHHPMLSFLSPNMLKLTIFIPISNILSITLMSLKLLTFQIVSKPSVYFLSLQVCLFARTSKLHQLDPNSSSHNRSPFLCLVPNVSKDALLHFLSNENKKEC